MCISRFLAFGCIVLPLTTYIDFPYTHSNMIIKTRRYLNFSNFWSPFKTFNILLPELRKYKRRIRPRERWWSQYVDYVIDPQLTNLRVFYFSVEHSLDRLTHHIKFWIPSFVSKILDDRRMDSFKGSIPFNIGYNFCV